MFVFNVQFKTIGIKFVLRHNSRFVYNELYLCGTFLNEAKLKEKQAWESEIHKNGFNIR